ncbi:hypothetical protein [Hymenobacter norwichensis]|uniref:hypothetical protein n=1 Tax=Hymenobacter norwichensis TaxID=223903 RepID=UPI0012F9A921|nr:hypothetical protein [Hymenobacter norwichensis]
MPRYILLLSTGLLATIITARAQTTSIRNDLSAIRYDRADTLRAVQHLFMQRSKATRDWLETGVGILASGVVKKTVLAASGLKREEKEYYRGLQQEANEDLVVGSLLAGYGIFRLSRFGPQQYQRVMDVYAQGGPLPQYLSRRLKTKFFRLLPS